VDIVINLDKRKVHIHYYDAHTVIPHTVDENGITECALVVRAYCRGKTVDQLEMHLRNGVGFFSHEGNVLVGNNPGTYRIVMTFTMAETELSQSALSFHTTRGCLYPIFGMVKPAVTNGVRHLVSRLQRLAHQHQNSNDPATTAQQCEASGYLRTAL